jgi:hypothetical protein
MKSPEIVKLVNSMYEWFNQIMYSTASYEKGDLREFFTSDFVMDLNGKVIVSGDESLYEHFKKFRDSEFEICVKLPLEEVVVSHDYRKCVAKYTIFKDLREIKVIAIWHLSDDRKLSRMNEVVYFGETSI